MNQPIVLSFDADGAVEYTRTKALTLFGGAGTMQRVTDIKKVPTGASYYIHWMLGPFAGHDHVYGMAQRFSVKDTPEPYSLSGNHDDVVQFPTYEAAVEHEIDMLNAMRKAGVRFGDQEA